MTLDMYLCSINSTHSQQQPQVAAAEKAEKFEEKFCMQNTNVSDTRSKLFQSLHEVKAVCWGKGFDKASISTCSDWGNLPDLTWKKQPTGWVQHMLEMSKRMLENSELPRLHWPHELRTGRAQPYSPRTLPKNEYSSRTVSWAHFLAVSWVSLEKPSISICKVEIANLPHFPWSL